MVEGWRQAVVWFGYERFEARKPTELHDTSCKATTTKTNKKKKILSPKKNPPKNKNDCCSLVTKSRNLCFFLADFRVLRSPSRGERPEPHRYRRVTTSGLGTRVHYSPGIIYTNSDHDFANYSFKMETKNNRFSYLKY